ncbi:YwmB family TATA-box binding protein [Shimazuella sp. AN120528]|uniref:YwmB family TATA-box binding protein n=1 Tax=Shimazuella soli TaxID=1892854 RepID=UPI001F111A2D|nr:YwmB family TATA-box binding protein [Shimazuella soli]MCH5585261.1 YwmB family TATA-box binding protein [Shimazuella soli]
MLRWIGILLISSIFLMGSSQPGSAVPQTLLGVAYKMEIEPTSYVVHHSGRTGHLVSASQAGKNMRQWVNELSLGKVEKRTDQDGIRYDASGKWGNLEVSFYMIIDQPEAKVSKPYIAIQVTGHGKPKDDWPKAAERIQKFLFKQEIPTHLHYSIQGNLDHSTDTIKTAHNIVKLLDAKEIEGMETDQTVSISAYSSLFSESIQTGGGKMNLQVATHRDVKDGKLIVTIGSPIITVEY